jgi:glycerol-3-phosphate dehydrogenase
VFNLPHSRETNEGKQMQKGKKPKRKPQQRDDIAKGIDTIQEVAETAISIYRVIEPIAKAILAIWGKGK